MKQGLIFSFGILLVFLSIIFLDQPLAHWVGQEHYFSVRYWSREITNFALGEIWFGFSLFLFLVGYGLPKLNKLSLPVGENIKRWSYYFFFSLLGSGVLLQLLKFLIGRQRPHRSEIFDPYVFKPLSTDWYFHSLPSGHSQVMFTSACCFALVFPRFSWFFYLLASIFAATRVLIFQHFLSDILAGAMVGYFGSLLIHDLLKNKIHRPLPFGFNDKK